MLFRSPRHKSTHTHTHTHTHPDNKRNHNHIVSPAMSLWGSIRSLFLQSDHKESACPKCGAENKAGAPFCRNCGWTQIAAMKSNHALLDSRVVDNFNARRKNAESISAAKGKWRFVDEFFINFCAPLLPSRGRGCGLQRKVGLGQDDISSTLPSSTMPVC